MSADIEELVGKHFHHWRNNPGTKFEDTLRAALAEHKRRSKWISVIDEPMPFDVFVLAYNGIENFKHKVGEYRITCPLMENTHHITHWMPLPPPPTDTPPQ